MEQIPFDEMIVHLEELLQIKYSSPKGQGLVKKLLNGRESKTIAIKIGEYETMAIHLREQNYSISTGDPETCSMRMAIPYRDLILTSMGKLPIKTFFRGKIGFRGSVRDAFIVRKLFAIPLADPVAAFAYFEHYFLGEN